MILYTSTISPHITGGRHTQDAEGQYRKERHGSGIAIPDDRRVIELYELIGRDQCSLR